MTERVHEAIAMATDCEGVNFRDVQCAVLGHDGPGLHPAYRKVEGALQKLRRQGRVYYDKTRKAWFLSPVEEGQDPDDA